MRPARTTCGRCPSRRDVVLDVRQIDVALRGLRRLGREGAEEELDLDETVDQTCKNAGEIEVVLVGDTLMHPAELLDPGGSSYLYSQNRASGHQWLRRLAAHFRSAAWCNPEPERFWAGTTIEVIASVFAMWPLTLDGLAQAVRYLVRGGERPRVSDPSRWMKAMTG